MRSEYEAEKKLANVEELYFKFLKKTGIKPRQNFTDEEFLKQTEVMQPIVDMMQPFFEQMRPFIEMADHHMHGKRTNWSDDSFHLVAYNLVSLLRIRHFGEKVFEPSFPLVNELIQTDVDNVKTEWVKFPFDHFYIHLSEGFGAIEMFDKKKRESFNMLDPLFGDNMSEREPVSGIAVHHMGDHVAMIVHYRKTKLGYEKAESLLGITKIPLVLNKETIKECIQETNWNAHSDFQLIGETFTVRVLNLVVNLMLYINSKNPDIVTPHGRRQTILDALAKEKDYKRRRQLEGTLNNLPSEHILLGSNIVLTPKEAPQGETGEETGRTWRVNVRYDVRGHWRNQPYGPGRKEHKLIWIRPQQRGPDMADKVNRKYTVE